MQRKPAPWFSALALVIAPLVAVPSFASAEEDEAPAESTEQETTPASDDEPAPEAPAAETEDEDEEAEPAADPEDEGDDESTEEATETVEEAPVPPPASPAAGPAAAGGTAGSAAGVPGVPAPRPADVEADEDEEQAEPPQKTRKADGSANVGTNKEGDKVNNASAMGAASPVVTDDAAAKPWLVSASLQSSLGSSVLADQNNDPLVGYSFSATFLYKLAKVWQGRLDAYGFLSFNQNLVDGATGPLLGGTGRNQFFLQDIQLGVLGRGIYTEKNTGIIFGFRSIGRLPTSDLAMAFDRNFRWDNGLTATKPFANVGPGTILLSLASTFRKDFGPGISSLDEGENPSRYRNCVASDPAVSADCFSEANIDWAVITGVGVRYLLNNGFGFNLSVSHLFNRSHKVNFPVDRVGDTSGNPVSTNGDFDAECDPTTGIQRCDAEDTSNALFASVSVSYVFNANWSVSTGVTTFQNVLIQSGDNTRSPSNPFWAEEPETNASSFFLSGTFTY